MPNFPTNVTKSDGNVEDTRSKGALGSEGNPYKLGERGSGIRLQGVIQDYDTLKKQHLSSETLFEDPEFPAEDTSIFPMERPLDRYPNEIVWKRPKEINADAKFFVDGTSRFDVEQGRFGNCWFAAAVSTLAMNKNLINKVIPPGQGDFNENYAGIFRFRFWQFGKWVEVVIDDRLPTYDGKLIGIHSGTSNEFWSALLEKAYAKLNGNWTLLEGGLSGEASEDFTGGFAQYRETAYAPPNLFEILLEAQEKNSLIACSTADSLQFDSDTEEDQKLEDLGLAPMHAYSLTKVVNYERKVEDKVEKIPLLRIRNPWGKKEWTGAWSEKSPEYESISEEDKEKYGFETKDDGEFLISYEDWKKLFSDYEICYTNPSLFAESNGDQMVKKNWEIGTIEGEWVLGTSAGGCLRKKNEENFQHNPQYCITLEEKSLAIIALMQKNRRTQRAESDFLWIGLRIYKLPENSETELPKPLDADFFKKNKPCLTHERIESLNNEQKNGLYYQARQVHCRAKLEPGSYCIVSSNADLDKEGSFLLRVFTEIPNNLELYDVQTGITDVEPTVLESANLYKDVGKVRTIFRKYAGDDWELDWSEYKYIMEVELQTEMYDPSFSKEAYPSIVALIDADDSGKIGYHEFQKFWQSAKIWMAAFSKHDKHGNGELKRFKLKETLKSAGYLVNHEILNLLQRRYATDIGIVKFGDYFLCAARLNKMISAYDELTFGKIDVNALTLDEWIKTTLRLA